MREFAAPSRIPQGFFFINEICNIVKYAEACDIKIYKEICSSEDANNLQNYLNSNSNWCHENGLAFSLKKYCNNYYF